MSKLNSELLAQCVEDLLAYSQGKTISKEGECDRREKRRGGGVGRRRIACPCRAVANTAPAGWLTGLRTEGWREGGHRIAFASHCNKIKHASCIYPYSPPLPPSLLSFLPIGEDVKGKVRNFNETIELQVGRGGGRKGGLAWTRKRKRGNVARGGRE